jgi:hypothetical protein
MVDTPRHRAAGEAPRPASKSVLSDAPPRSADKATIAEASALGSPPAEAGEVNRSARRRAEKEES